MHYRIIFFFFVFPFFVCGITPKKSISSLIEKNSTIIAFTENKGQVHDQNYKSRPDVLYSALVGNMVVHIKNSGVSYQLYRVDNYKEEEDYKTKQKHNVPNQQTNYRIDLKWINYNKSFTKSEDEMLAGYNNYYLENCPDGVMNVKSYRGLTLHNLYNGIDLHYYQKNGELKHDYIVAPHANYQQIQLKVDGADIMTNKDGSLLLSTPLGKVEEGVPIVFQNGKQLKARWKVTGSSVNFEVENYNPDYELIIDPLTRVWGTYCGGSGDDKGNSSATDASGNLYLVGTTSSSTSTVIATQGSHQQTYAGGNSDAFLVKFNNNGQRIWGTYYGASGDEDGVSCSTDVMGNVFLAGSSIFGTSAVIATLGSHQQTNGGFYDSFIVKFNVNGLRQWGTYYGGNGSDYGRGCTTDALGNVFLTGETGSNTGTVIATQGSHQQAHSGGTYDAFLVKFDAGGQRLWGTYYGSTNGDVGSSCATDTNGNVYMAGYSNYANSGTLIATPGGHQQTCGGINGSDAILVKFNANGQRQWGTYYGGGGGDGGLSCATDATGNIYLAGYSGTNTGTIIATIGSHQQINGGGPDAFLVKFNGSGQRQWGTYYGNNGADFGYSCATDTKGNIYLSGVTTSTAGTVIATTGSHQQIFGGNYDAFLVQFNSNGQRGWGTYYGGSGTEFGNSCVTNTLGKVFLVGYSDSNSGTAVASSGSYQQINNGSNDAFLVQFTCPSLGPWANANSPTCIGDTLSLTGSVTNSNAVNYYWTGSNSFTSAVHNPVIPNSAITNSGIYTLTVGDGFSCSEYTTVTVLVQSCVGITENESDLKEIKIYPNPSTGKLEINNALPGFYVEVYNNVGQKLEIENYQINQKVEIDLSNKPDGIYFIKVGSTTKKIIKH